MSVISEPFVKVVLGPQWLEAIPVMSNLAGLMVVMTVYMPLTVILTVKNKMHILFVADVIIVILISIMLYLSFGHSIDVISFNRLLIGMFFLLFMIGLYTVVAELNSIRLLSLVLLPLGCSWFMYEVVAWLVDFVDNDYYKLVLAIASGFVIYAISAIISVNILKSRVYEFQVIVQQLKKQASLRLGLLRSVA